MAKLRVPRYPLHVLLRRGALAYLVVWVLSPPLAYGNRWRLLAVLAIVTWLAMNLREARSVVFRPSWPVLGVWFFVSYTAIIMWLVPGAGGINQQLQLWIMLFFLVVGESFRRGHEDDARFCFWLVLLVLPVWMFSTIRGLEDNAHVARLLVRNSDEARELTQQGIGGYGFVYTVVLCLPFLAQLALRFRAGPEERTQSRWLRRGKFLLVWGNFLLAVLLVLRAGYSIAIILSLLAVLCVLLVRSRRGIPFAISICFVCVLVFLGNFLLEPALRSLEGVVAGTEYSRKVHDVLESLEGGQSTGTLEDRMERYVRSLDAFIGNPLIGSRVAAVGGHSSYLDRFGQFGIAVGALFLALLIYVPLRFLRFAQVPIGLSLAFLIVAVVFPMVNNVFMSWGLVLYVFSRGALVTMGIPLAPRRRKPRAAMRWDHGAGVQEPPR